MASDTASDTLTIQESDELEAARRRRSLSAGSNVVKLLMSLASLRLTVVLFALAIFLIFAGTLAQVDKDILDVLSEYFRTYFTKIRLQIFFPRSFFAGPAPEVPGWFWFPGGKVIGGAMIVNLLAAHALRFKTQARGPRLLAGLAVVALGVVVTWMVVLGGSGKDMMEGSAPIAWSTLWTAMKFCLVALWCAGLYALVQVDRTRKIERWGLAAFEAALGTLVIWLLWRGPEAQLGDSSLRIMWQLIEGGAAGLVLLAGCALIFRKRAGIVLLHAGVLLVMTNEIVVATLHEEGQMRIMEGETVDFVSDIRTLELAVIDPSNPKTDDVVVVPAKLFEDGQLVSDDNLPFGMQVVELLRNSSLKDAKSGDKNLATAGLGLQAIAVPRRAGVGTDVGGEVDVTAAYVKLTKKGTGKETGEPIATYLCVAGPLPEQKVRVGDKTYNLALRFKRTYKPYSMKLADVRFDKYLGTETAKNYSSELHLVDSSRGVDRDNVKISMNNPLRFAGETFYQQHYFNDQEGREGTVLQVVTNTGWMIPYVACMLVGTGLLAQFSITLTRFLRRRDEAQVVAVRESLGRRTAAGFSPRRAERRVAPEARFVWAFPSLVVLAAACFVAYVAREPHAPSDEMRLEEFGRLPVVYEGRVKPLDTVARNVLRIVSDKQTFIDDTGETPKRGQPAIKWLLDAIVKPDMAFRHKVFRIVNPALLESLGLKRREGLRYSPNEFWDQVGQLERQAAVASETDPHKLSVDQKQVVELVKNLRLFIAMNLAFKVQPIRMEKEHFEADWRDALDHLEMLSQMQRHGQGPPLAIPPDSSDAKWEAFSASVIKNIQAEAIGKEPNPATVSMATMLFAYRKGDAKLFNATLAEYETWLAAHSPSDLDESKVQYEAFFNYFAPFWWAAWLYLTAFVLVALGWLGWTVPLNRAALWLVLFTLALHTFAIISRIYISGRPPVTNLYSSAIFIGWGGVVLGIVLEMVYRLGIGTVIASVAGFVTLLIAYFLSASGDTMTVLLAVLDTQFWLATHVVCVTLGYATTYIAGLLGVLYILRGVLTPSLSPAVGKDMARMIYGTLCFAMFFSFVGTVLGGLWADDSWGRFWGWDPKENGALMIVLWNALVLHARWGGMVRERGLANLAIVGNIVVSWSYFGVNELGVGLHSYGFTEGVLLTLGLFTASQLGTIALGLIPRRLWWSSRAQPA